VKAFPRKGGRHRLRLAWGLALTGAVLVSGCGQPDEGTVQVSETTRDRLSPQFGPKATDTKNRQSLAGQKIGIKNRAPGAPNP
jgi:hypothetical protein